MDNPLSEVSIEQLAGIFAEDGQLRWSDLELPSLG